MTSNKTIYKISIFVLSLIVILSIVPVILYLNNSSCFIDLGCSFASSSEEWARFGSYVGGVLGPFYAFCAFVAVLFTLYLQSRQIADFNNRASIDEIQRLVASTSSIVDESLSSHREHDIEAFPVKTFDKLIAYAVAMENSTSSFLANSDVEDHAQLRKKTLDQFDDLFGADLTLLSGELNRLANCLIAYCEAGGSAVVEKIYVYRYRYYAVWLFEIGHIDKADLAYSYFKVESLLVAEAAEAKAKTEVGARKHT